MDNKLDDQFLLIPASIEDKNQTSDEKMKKYESALDKIKRIIKQVLFQNKNYSPEKIYSTKDQEYTTVVPSNNKAPPPEVGNSTKMVTCGLSKMR